LHPDAQMPEQQRTTLCGRQDQTTIRRLQQTKIAITKVIWYIFVPRTKTKMANRAFQIAGPRTWNSLPVTIRETKTLPAFKKQLKL